jgi:D-aminopeptidase
MDGDLVFAAATGRATQEAGLADQVEIGALAADCLARAIARAIYSAEGVSGTGVRPSWRQRFINQNGRHTS